MKVVINKCCGRFRLSRAAMKKYADLQGWRWESEGDYTFLKNDFGEAVYDTDIPRDCPLLVEVVETLGGKVSSFYSELKVVEIPDGVDFTISDYGGMETIHEKHRSWG